MILLGFVAFLAATALAIPWTLWAKWVAENKRHKAGIADAAIYLITAVFTSTLIESRWCMFPAAFGAYVGTVLSMWVKDVQAAQVHE